MKKILMFTASWCGPCQRAKPVFNTLKETSTNIDCVLVDVDEQAHLAEKFNIRAVPTFVLLNDDTEVARISGGVTVEKLNSFVNQ